MARGEGDPLIGDDLWDDEVGARGGRADDVDVRVSIAGLGVGEATLFPFVRDGWDHTGIVVRHRDGLSVFVNRCPHVPYPLDLGDGRVWTPDHERLLCSNHGAEFDRRTGRCVAGPVVGRALERLSYTRDGDTLVVTIPPTPPDWPGDG